MTIKVRYENGVFKPLNQISIKEGELLEIEIKEKKATGLIGIPAEEILPKLKGIMKVGGDALKDSEEIYE